MRKRIPRISNWRIRMPTSSYIGSSRTPRRLHRQNLTDLLLPRLLRNQPAELQHRFDTRFSSHPPRVHLPEFLGVAARKDHLSKTVTVGTRQRSEERRVGKECRAA